MTHRPTSRFDLGRNRAQPTEAATHQQSHERRHRAARMMSKPRVWL